MNRTLRAGLAIGVSLALADTGVVGVARDVAPLDTHRFAVQLTAGEQDIVIDFVRHGATTSPSPIGHQGLPGYPLSPEGQQEADAVAIQLQNEFGQVAGIFAGQNQRMSETAEPFAQAVGMDITTLSGINEVGGGIFNGVPSGSLGEIFAFLIPFTWAFGLRFVPMPGSNDYNGMQFEENVGNAINTIYTDALENGTESTNGQVTALAFSGEAMISAWVMMNVDNPDIAIFLPMFADALTTGTFLGHTSQVVVEGNPTDGWTLLSFDGQAIPENPGLLTDLIVDLRDLITPPQTAAWDAFLGIFNSPSVFEDALEEGLKNVGSAIVQFPGAVITDTVDAVQALGSDLAAGESFSDAFGSAILGLPS